MTRSTVATDLESAVEAPTPRPKRAGRLRRLVVAARPLLFLAVVAALVALAGAPEYDPMSPRSEYTVRAIVVGVVAVGTLAWWWSARRGRSWGPDLVPALLGGVTALTLVTALHGTPYAPGGLSGDQSFRTAAITRFADSWHNADFTFQGLPSFYAPAYFWVLGRAADLTGIEAWRMTKYGTIAVALLVPVVTYLLWRRLVPAPVAVPLAAVPVVVENYFEPYAWLVIVALVPWWLEAVHGLRRPDRRPGHPLLLGLVGGLLFMTYYYFFFIAAIALVIHLVVERAHGRPRLGGPGGGAQPRRAVLVLAIAAAVSAVYWLPLLVSMVRAEHVESLANRWFNAGHADLPLPMLEPSVAGAVALLGLGFLVVTAGREPLSRGLLVFLAAAYGWYLVGAVAAVADTPLLSFRGKPLVPLILLTAGVLALVRLARLAAARFAAADLRRPADLCQATDPRQATDVRRVAWVAGALLLVYVGQAFVTTVRDSPLMVEAHAAAWPDGRRSPYHRGDAAPPEPPAAEVHRAVVERFDGEGQPVLLSNRVDVMALYPFHGFLQWNAHFAHPAAEFHARVRFLKELAASDSPAEFADRSADNRFDRIDGFLLRDRGDVLVLRYAEDAFPEGTEKARIEFPRTLFTPDRFHLVPLGDHLLAVRR
jgi:hypothetical protein